MRDAEQKWARLKPKLRRLAIIILLASLFCIFSFGALFYNFPETFGQLYSAERVIKVTDREIADNQKFIFAEDATYWVNDSPLDWHYTSRDTYRLLVPGHEYRVRTRGFRWGRKSMHANIVEIIEEMSGGSPVNPQE